MLTEKRREGRSASAGGRVRSVSGAGGRRRRAGGDEEEEATAGKMVGREGEMGCTAVSFAARHTRGTREAQPAAASCAWRQVGQQQGSV